MARPPISPELAPFLARFQPATREKVTWTTGYQAGLPPVEFAGRVPLAVTAYGTREAPPEEWVTSVRAVVLGRGTVLVVSDPDGVHLLPGGRLQPGESFEAALRRELAEETGWKLAEPRPIGFLHYHHLAPKPADWPHPYPDFLQAVYVATATAYHPALMDRDAYEKTAVFRPLIATESLPLSLRDYYFLQLALEARNRPSGE